MSKQYKRKKLLSFGEIEDRLQDSLGNKKYAEILKYYTDIKFRGSFTRSKRL